ncbi:uncharacterized protein BDCG_06300 [Blastomyces dermatitidis ER-3]|nr:uncharacterized protein BDCG_06300 [Blastomyces dermatitidis ER-3]EEQ91180.2 hypothetical protein BDCG_06300 [Blastomyces dermatitidis ER-3]
MVESFLTPQTNRIIKHIVEPQYDGSIGRAAAWADECGRTDEGKDSPTWHYINPADNPPAYETFTTTGTALSRDALSKPLQMPQSRLSLAYMPSNLENSNMNRTSRRDEEWEGVERGLPVVNGCAEGSVADVEDEGAGDSSSDRREKGRSGSGTPQSSQPKQKSTTASPTKPSTLTSPSSSRASRGTISTSPFKQVECTDPNCLRPRLVPRRECVDVRLCLQPVFNDTDLLETGYASGAVPIVQSQVSKFALRLATWLNRLVGGWYRDREVILRTHPSWMLGPMKGK